MADNTPPQTSGAAVSKGAAGSDLVIAGNQFRYFRLVRGAGPIAVNFTSQLTIADNQISDVVFGSGMRLYKDHHVVVRGNKISRIGRTGVMLINVEDGLVTHNLIHDLRGIHGNGISTYLANHGVRVVANTGTDALRPITYEGVANDENDLEFTSNLLVGTPDSDAALTSWGQNKRVVIQGNVLIGGKNGLAVSTTDAVTTVKQNLMNGELAIKGGGYHPPGFGPPPPPAWVVAGNRTVSWGGPGFLKGKLERSVADALAEKPTGAWRDLCEFVKQEGTGEATAVGADLKCPTAKSGQ